MRKRAAAGLLAASLLVSCTITAEPNEEAKSMNEESAHTHHTVDYIELAVTDMAEARRFYSTAFGWVFNDYGPEYAGIRRSATDATREVGGLRLDAKVVTGGPLVILYSEDLETTVEAVRDAGGRIVKDPFEFPGGRRFHFTDPAGNELAVWADRQELKETPYQIARGAFVVSMKPLAFEGAEPDSKLGRMSIDKQISGDLTGSSVGQMLSAMTSTDGSAGYVAVERVTGVLNGRRGAFVLQHTGTMDRGTPSLVVTVVPDSGTDELLGLEGEFKINIEDGKHFYEFKYHLPAKPA